MLHLMGSDDWIQIQILLKAKLLKWWTEYTDFGFARHSTTNKNRGDEFLFCHYYMLLFFHLWMSSPYFTLTTLPSIDLLLLNLALTAIKFAERIHVATSTEHWRAFSWPPYGSVVLGYLRRENHQETAKNVCRQKRNGKKRKNSVMAITGCVDSYPGCCLQTIPISLVTAVLARLLS